MAQSEFTVTPPSPTPPTNMSFAGITGPNPPNYTKLSYAGMETDPYPGTNPPAFYDDGTAGALTAFATQTAAIAGGSTTTAGGTEGSYPGTGSPAYTNPNNVGAVPAGTSSAPEGAGSEVVVTSPGSRTECPTQQVSDLGSYVYIGNNAGVGSSINSNHASAKAPTVLPTITALTPSAPVATGSTTPLTVTGTGFRMDSVIYVGGVPQTTNYISATSLSCLNAPKRTTAGNTPITVVTGGTATAATNWVFS